MLANIKNILIVTNEKDLNVLKSFLAMEEDWVLIFHMLFKIKYWNPNSY